MCMSGALTGTAATAQVRRPTRRDRRQALAASFVVVVGSSTRGAAVSRFVSTTALASVTTAAVSASSSFLRITIAKNNTKLKKRKKIRLGCGGGRASVVRDERSKHGSGRNQEREKNGELVDRSEV